MNFLKNPNPNNKLSRSAFTALTGVALLAGCEHSPEDPINREEIIALQSQVQVAGLFSDCSYVYQKDGDDFRLNNTQLEKNGLTKAAQELTAQNNILVVPASLTDGTATSLTELQKNVISISSKAIATTMVPPRSAPIYTNIAICPSTKVLEGQTAHIVVASPPIPSIERA